MAPLSRVADEDDPLNMSINSRRNAWETKVQEVYKLIYLYMFYSLTSYEKLQWNYEFIMTGVLTITALSFQTEMEKVICHSAKKSVRVTSPAKVSTEATLSMKTSPVKSPVKGLKTTSPSRVSLISKKN